MEVTEQSKFGAFRWNGGAWFGSQIGGTLWRMGVALAALGAIALPLVAHETWLLPATFQTTAGERLTIDLTSGMSFPALESGASPERVASARARSAGEVVTLSDIERAEKSLRFEHAFEREGLATVWVSLHPREIDLDDEQVTEYFDEIAGSASVRETWAGLRGREKWHERYTKHAKTFVTVGGRLPADAGSDDSWSEPVGLALEIVPDTDPRDLRAGQKASFRLLRNGAPIQTFAVGLIIEGAPARIFETTDDAGRVTFTFERAGRAMLFATHLRREARPDGAGEEWRSDFTNLTVVVAQPSTAP